MQSDQSTEGILKDCTGSHGPQRSVVLAKEIILSSSFPLFSLCMIDFYESMK
jgi:hypothetical protein